MNKTLILVLCAGFSTMAYAQRAPRTAFAADKMDEAKAEALAKGKPIAVVITDTKSSCPKCQDGNVEAFARLRSKYVMVIEDKAEKGQLPQNVRQTVNTVYTTKGNIIPIVAVIANDDYRLLGGLCYKQISEGESKAFRALEQEVEESLAKGGAAAAPKPAAQSAAPAATAKASDEDESDIRDWTNLDGKTIRAAAIAFDNGKVSFRMENGKVVDYPVKNLSEESRESLAKTYPEASAD
jgi:hypothetical protein